MRKSFLIILILAGLVFSAPVLAKEKNNESFWATVINSFKNLFAQEETRAVPSTEEAIPVEEQKEEQEEYVDPREVKQVLREIKDQRRELNRIAKQLKKLPNSADDLNLISSLLEKIANFEKAIKSETNLRDTIQEFREEQIWEQMNILRAKAEIPREMKQWNQEIKKLERIIKQKAFQKLGLDLEKAKAKIEELKAALAKVQEFYNSGDLESAIEEFDGLRQELHPGEISSVLYQMREVMDRLRMIKNEEIRNMVKELLNEVITNFNEGEYRVAREIMDESRNEIMSIIAKAYKVGKKKGYTKEKFSEMAEKLEEQMRDKAEEKKARMEEIMEKVREMKAEPAQPAEQAKPAEPTTQSAQPAQPAEPAQPSSTSGGGEGGSSVSGTTSQ